MAIFLIAFGLLITGIDIHIFPGIAYPDYIPPHGEYMGVMIKEGIQQHVNQNILGGQFQMDILPDVLGCLLILIGACMMIKHNKKFIQCIFLAVITGGLSIAIRVVPFFLNSGDLIVTTLALFAFLPFFELLMEYRVIYLTVGVSDEMANQGTNKRMQFCWGITVFARIFYVLLTFSGLGKVRRFYEAAILIFVLAYVYLFLETRKYVGIYKVYKEGFNSAVIPDYIREKITGVSFPEDNRDIAMDDLRYTRILHYDFEGRVQEGEIIVHKNIAYQTMKVFYQLYKIEYPIEKVRLIEEYDGDDILSMEDNNSSGFNYRTVEGRDELSKHAMGLAIDINPRINPYVRKDEFFPKNAEEYLERDVEKCSGKHRDKMIHKKDLAYRIFRRNGFAWGGEWEREKDYQHFVAVQK